MLETIWEGDVQYFDRVSALILHSGPDTGLRHIYLPPLCDEEPGGMACLLYKNLHIFFGWVYKCN